MDESTAIEALSALAQPTRLAVFRRLASAYPDDMPAGDIARQCEVPHNTMSSHLAILTRAGLTTACREGRAVRYRASVDRLCDLVAFLARGCCDGHPALCVPLSAEPPVSWSARSCRQEVNHG